MENKEEQEVVRDIVGLFIFIVALLICGYFFHLFILTEIGVFISIIFCGYIFSTKSKYPKNKLISTIFYIVIIAIIVFVIFMIRGCSDLGDLINALE